MELMNKKIIRVVAAVIEKDGRYLITQRKPNALLPLLWEFPGGKVEEGEDDKTALKREMMERLMVPIEVGGEIASTLHEYSNYIVDFHLYEATLLSTNLRPVGVYAYRWVSSSEFDKYQFTPADEKSMNKLLGIK